MRKLFTSVALSGLLIAGVGAIAAGGGSFTTINSQTKTVEGGQHFTNTIGKNDAIGRDLSGRIKLVATGTTTKTATNSSGVGVWNYKMWWDDSPAGSAYLVTKRTMWNPGEWDVILWDTWANDGHHGSMAATAGWTDTDYYISTGTATTKASVDEYSDDGVNHYSWTACIYLTPGGGSFTYGVACSV